MHSSYWIIGGEYTDTAFSRIVAGTERVLGPYPSREAAMPIWRELADETRANCCARYTIAQELGR